MFVSCIKLFKFSSDQPKVLIIAVIFLLCSDNVDASFTAWPVYIYICKYFEMEYEDEIAGFVVAHKSHMKNQKQ